MIAAKITAPMGLLLLAQQVAAEWKGPITPDFKLPANVKADTEATFGINNKIANTDPNWTVYDVYLAFQVPEAKDTTTACALATKVKLDTTEIKAKIPADVAPDGTQMFLKEIMYNKSPYENNTSPSLTSMRSFSFQDGKGEFADFEKEGGWVGYTELIPCSAYACARKCAADSRKKGKDYDSKAEFSCLSKCDGAKFPSWDNYLKHAKGEQTDDEEDDSTSSTTVSSTMSSTATASSASQTSGTATTGAAAATSTNADGAAGHVAASGAGLLLAGAAALYALF